MMGIRQRQERVVSAFLERLRTEESSPIPASQDIFVEQAKRDALFHPDQFSSDAGSGAVSFMTEKDQKVQRDFQEVYARLKRRYVSVFQNQTQCLAPVYIAEQSANRSVTFAMFPPFINTRVVMAIPMPTTPKGKTLTIKSRPPIPEKYDCSSIP